MGSGEREPGHWIGRLWSSRDSYVALVGLLLLTFLLGAIVGDSRAGEALILVVTLFALLLALQTSDVAPRTIRWVVAIFAIMFASSFLVPPAYRAFGGGGGALVAAAAYVIGALAILRRIGRHTVIGLETVMGAISAYVILGYAFGHAYVATQAFSGAPFFTDGRYGNLFDFQYFSFVTLTTLGYGDLSPASTTGRSLAVLEALLGQIFLITAVARLVSLWGQERPELPAAGPLAERMEASAARKAAPLSDPDEEGRPFG